MLKTLLTTTNLVVGGAFALTFLLFFGLEATRSATGWRRNRLE
jgi:hypothetical protein